MTPNLKLLIETLLEPVKEKCCTKTEASEIYKKILVVEKQSNSSEILELIPEVDTSEKNDEILDDLKKKKSDVFIVIDGVNIDTMKPVKMKGSMLAQQENFTPILPTTPPVEKLEFSTDENVLIINSPYKFDPKRLTKSQKARLSRRRDDIPALYQDLSQSQTLDFSSNSEPIFPDTEQEKEMEEKIEEVVIEDRPFSKICENFVDEEDLSEKNDDPQEEIRRRKKIENELHRIETSMVGYDKIDVSKFLTDTNSVRKTRKNSRASQDPVEERLGKKPRKRGRPSKTKKDVEESQENSEKKTDNIEGESESECIIESSQEENSKDVKSLKRTRVTKSFLQADSPNDRNKKIKPPEANSDEDPDENHEPEKSLKKSKKIVPILVLSRSHRKGSPEKFTLVTKDVKPPESSDETASINTQILNELPEETTTEYPNANASICRKVLFDKNSSDSDETVETQISADGSPKRKSPLSKIVTSPIRNDTPMRNKELVNSTMEISPIKTCSVIVKDILSIEKSPDLFESDQPSEAAKEVVESSNSTPVIPQKMTCRNSLFLPGRGAQMINLLPPNIISNRIKPIMVSSDSREDEKVRKLKNYFVSNHYIL